MRRTKTVRANFIGVPKKVRRFAAEGSYNSVELFRGTVKFSDGRTFVDTYWVVKTAKDKDRYSIEAAASAPSRFVDIFTEIYPEFPVGMDEDHRVIMPYLGNEEPSDIEIAQEIIRIYQKTGRIIADGCGANNFVKFEGKTICIDTDLALKESASKRRASITSNNYLKDITQGSRVWDEFYKSWEDKKPTSVFVIKYLLDLDLKKHKNAVSEEELKINLQLLCDILNSNILSSNPDLSLILNIFLNYRQCVSETSSINDSNGQLEIQRHLDELSQDDMIAIVKQPELCQVIINMNQWRLIPNMNLLLMLTQQPQFCTEILKTSLEAQADLYHALHRLSYYEGATKKNYEDVLGCAEKRKALSCIDQFNEKSYSADYNERPEQYSIRTFCKETTESCLTCWDKHPNPTEWKPALAKELRFKANRHLGRHADSGLRGFADVVCVLFAIGIVIYPIKRLCTGSWFFSSAPTAREERVEQKIIPEVSGPALAA